jgi:hypothetical protein
MSAMGAPSLAVGGLMGACAFCAWAVTKLGACRAPDISRPAARAPMRA